MRNIYALTLWKQQTFQNSSNKQRKITKNFENEHQDPVFEPQQFTEYATGSGDDEIGIQRKLPVTLPGVAEKASDCRSSRRRTEVSDWSSGENVWQSWINGANLALLTVATQKYRRNAANINRGLVAFASEWSSSPKRLIPGASSERRRSGSRKWEPEKTPSIAGSEVISGRIQGFRLINVGPGLN